MSTLAQLIAERHTKVRLPGWGPLEYLWLTPISAGGALSVSSTWWNSRYVNALTGRSGLNVLNEVLMYREDWEPVGEPPRRRDESL